VCPPEARVNGSCCWLSQTQAAVDGEVLAAANFASQQTVRFLFRARKEIMNKVNLETMS
jgi:hypothetical protein